MSGSNQSSRRQQQVRVRPVVKRAAARSTNTKKKTIVIPSIHRNESARAQQYMFKYKVGNGRRAVHVNDGVYNYGTDKCPDFFNGKGRCPRGKKCRFAHTSLESLFHPLAYKTRLCSKMDCEQGEGCAWAHSSSDLRIRGIILGRDWKARDPITAAEREALRPKKNKRKRLRKRRGSLLAKEEKSETSGSGSESAMSMSQTYSEKLSNMSVSMSPQPREEKEAVTAPETAGENDGMSSFERWFRGVFDCEDECGAHVGYLRRLEASALDDISLLWGLRSEMPHKFVDLLVNEIGMTDERTRDALGEAVEEWMHPQSVRGWMERVVGLPQYVDVLSRHGRELNVLMHVSFSNDGLAEMGISSAGHRAKILMHLGRLVEE